MTMYSSILGQPIPQSEPLNERQIPNHGGGFAYKIDKWQLLRRFLIIGSEGGTYYVKEQKLTQDNAKNVIECIKEDGESTIGHILDVSKNGKAPKNDAAIFALAMCMTHGSPETKQLAYGFLAAIARTGTHLFQFVEDVQAMRGWSRGLRKSVANWYLAKSTETLEYQLLKYKQRNGYTHRDVLRLCHAKSFDSHMNSLLRVAAKGVEAFAEMDVIKTTSPRFKFCSMTLPGLIEANDVIAAIIAYDLTREMIPTQFLNSKAVWSALLLKMPMHAMLRNLAKMTAVGLLGSNFDHFVETVYKRLSDETIVKKSRLHPLDILNALRVYSSGKGDKGKLSWTPVSEIVEALNKSFYLSFENVIPSNKNIMIGLDISGSMAMSTVGGTSMTAREASAALCLVTASVEPKVEIMAFAGHPMGLRIPRGMPLESVIDGISNIPFGHTDCALPILYAIEKNYPAEIFVVYTDSETNIGKIHPAEALKKYREQTGINAKLIVVAMTATEVSIADPMDAGMLDIAGFSTDTPSLISEFCR